MTAALPPTAAAGEAWQQVRVFLRERCGVVVSDEQMYLLESRLGPVARQLAFPSIAAFVSAACAARAPAAVQEALIDAMTTHETFFFRDTRFWLEMETTVLPPLLARGGVVKIWSAACSTGQEAYSLAMLLHERWPDDASRVRIVATDVARPSVEKAKAGIYTSLEANRGLASRRLLQHFEPHEPQREGQVGGFKIRPHLQNAVEWRTQNLVSDEPPERDLDVVLCRNVLIYFDEATRARVVSRLFGALRPAGLLGVGSSELLPATPVSAGWYRRPNEERKP